MVGLVQKCFPLLFIQAHLMPVVLNFNWWNGLKYHNLRIYQLEKKCPSFEQWEIQEHLDQQILLEIVWNWQNKSKEKKKKSNIDLVTFPFQGAAFSAPLEGRNYLYQHEELADDSFGNCQKWQLFSLCSLTIYQVCQTCRFNLPFCILCQHLL